MKRWLISGVVTVVLILLAVVIWDRYGPRPSAPPLAPLAERIDRIEIDKSDRRLTVFRNGTAFRSYNIALGFSPEGDKTREGDGKTPEGRFVIDRRNPQSAFHLSLGINYPQPEDIERAAAEGVSPGGDIFIHGQPNGTASLLKLRGDWTAGCIALSNSEMEELWRVTANGTEVIIQP